MQSKLKLAGLLFTVPTVAFQEIIERRLLVDAFKIVGLAGLLAMLCSFVRVAVLGYGQAFSIGRDNPLTWIGLWMLYSLITWGLLKSLKSQMDYVTVLIVLGWSQGILVAYYAIGLIWGIAMAVGVTNEYVVRLFSAIGMVLPIIFAITIGRGFQATTRVSFAKGMFLYLIVALGMVIGLDLIYSQKLFASFSNSLPGISMAQMRVLPITYSVDADPWLRGMNQIVRLLAGGVGLVLGIWWLAKFEIWDNSVRNKYVLYSAIVTLAAVSIYSQAWSQDDYHSLLLRAQNHNRQGRYAEAARDIKRVLPLVSDNPMLMWGFPTKASLISDTADLYYQANQPDKTKDQYNAMLKYADDHAPNSDYRKIFTAQAYNGLGMGEDMSGNYVEAIEQFKKAAKTWTLFREPWVRMAVTYNRTRNYAQAIKSANHAIDKLKSEAAVAHLALVEAYSNTGNTEKAKKEFSKAEKINPILADRIGDKPEDWKTISAKLKTEDLRFPLEAYPAKLHTPDKK